MNRINYFTLLKRACAVLPLTSFLLSFPANTCSQGLWTCMTNKAQFSERADLHIVSFDNKMYTLNGDKDVWYSSNGKDWTLAIENVPFSKSSACSPTVFSYNGYMWIMNGSEG